MIDKGNEFLKNIPIPGYGQRGRVSKYNFKRMAINDAIRIDVDNDAEFNRITACAYALKKKTGMRFTSRWYGDHGMIWRVE